MLTTKQLTNFAMVEKQADKLMIVAFEKRSGSPSGVVLLKKKAYDPEHLRPLGEHPIEADMTRTTRKTVLGTELLHQEG